MLLVIANPARRRVPLSKECQCPLCPDLLVLDYSPAHLAQMRGLWSTQSMCEMQACH
jgi:hypothetical protein